MKVVLQVAAMERTEGGSIIIVVMMMDLAPILHADSATCSHTVHGLPLPRSYMRASDSYGAQTRLFSVPHKNLDLITRG